MPKHRTPLPAELKELIRLMRQGRLFEVQKWIQDGKSIRLPAEGHFIVSPMLAAIRIGFHSMVEVMLEQLGKEVDLDRLLNEAVQMNRLDLIELLYRFGADPKSVPYETVVYSHDPGILLWFENKGIDLVTGYPLATAFQYKYRAALGTYMRCKKQNPHLVDQANMALRFHARQGNIKWVCLLLWAGAEARAQGPSLGRKYADDDGSALHDAIFYERWDVVDKFKIDPTKDNLNRLLYEAAHSTNKQFIEQLLSFGADPCVTGLYSPVERCMWSLSRALEEETSFSYKHRDATDILCLFASKGATWKPPEKESIGYLRRTLAKANPGAAIETLIRLVRAGFFDKSVFKELMSTPRMKELLRAGRPGIVQLREYVGFEEKTKRLRQKHYLKAQKSPVKSPVKSR